VEFNEKGKNTKMRVGADGAILTDNQNSKTTGFHLPSLGLRNTDVSTLPAPVQDAVRKHGGEVADIDKKTDNGRTFYKIEFKEKGKNPTLYLADDGTVAPENKRSWLPSLG